MAYEEEEPFNQESIVIRQEARPFGWIKSVDTRVNSDFGYARNIVTVIDRALNIVFEVSDSPLSEGPWKPRLIPKCDLPRADLRWSLWVAPPDYASRLPPAPRSKDEHGVANTIGVLDWIGLSVVRASEIRLFGIGRKAFPRGPLLPARRRSETWLTLYLGVPPLPVVSFSTFRQGIRGPP